MAGGVVKDFRLYECKIFVVHTADDGKVVVQRGMDYACLLFERRTEN